jgi:hypothetical protein
MARKENAMLEVILKQFEEPDEVRTFDKGCFDSVAGSAAVN